MRCPRCKKTNLRKLVQVTLDMDADQHQLDKTHLRDKDIEVVGANYIQATYYCPNAACGFTTLKSSERD